MAAGYALGKPVNKKLAVSYPDFKMLTNMYIKKKKLWQRNGKDIQRIKLYKIQPKVDDPGPSHGQGHHEERLIIQD